MRPRARTSVLVAGVTLAAAGVAVAVATPALAAATGGVGATLPYVQVQAENSTTNGTIIGPSAQYNTLAAEASYRKAVTLQGQGKYVEFTTPTATNSIVFRYSIPDSGNGSVYTAPLSLYVNGTRQTNFTLTNAYSWYYGGYPFTNTPGSNAHHFYDEVNRLFPQTYPAGTKFRLQVDADSTASSYTIDFADFENVAAPLAQPTGSVSITSRGGDPTGVQDSTSAMNQAIAAAGAGGTVWIPPGTFKIQGHIAVNNITIKGAGMWHSRTQGDRIGFYGNYPPTPSANVHLADFAIFGNVQERNDGDQVNGIGGAMSNSTVDRVWIEHTKVGAWMDGPFTNLVFNQMRLRNYTADAINFHNGVTNSRVTNSDVRNAGDDGLAMWAEQNADANNSFDHNTVQYPILANGIAIYGGRDNVVADNRIVDSGLSQGGGIHVGQRFNSTPLGRTDILRNTIIRSGSLDPNWNFGVGALWFDARDAAMSGLINVDNILIQQSPFEAIQFVSGSSISNVKINNATIQNTGTWAIQQQVGGSATISNSTATGIGAPAAIYNCGVGFTLTDGGGNSGLSGTGCQNITNPAFPPYLPENGSNVTVSPSALGFGSVATGSTSAAQAVTVTNSGNASAAVGTIAVTGDFAQTNTCGTSLTAGASCTVNVTFRPTAAGSRTGNLSVTAGGVTTTVPLSGTGVAPGPLLNANPATLSFPGTVVGSSSGTQTVTVTNSGTTAATVSGVSTSGDFSQTNNCSSLAVGASCTVTVRFNPAAAGARSGALTVTSNANNSPLSVALSGSGVGTETNIALNKPATASSQVNGTQAAVTVTDGNAATYWESVNNAFPQWIQVDLGAVTSIGRVTLKLPSDAAWATRTQTLSVLASNDGSNFTTLSASAGRTFNPTSGNTVNITVPATNTRYVRINITANTGWPAGQIAELEVYPSGGGNPNAPTLNAVPGSLTFASQALNTTSSSQAVTVTNAGTAAATVSGVSVSGDYSQTNNCGSIAVGASCVVNVSFRPTAAGARTGTLTITSNASNSPTTVSLTGTGTSGSQPVNLAAGRPTAESSHVQAFGSGNVTDGDQNSYWESANNAFPQWVQVDLGSAQSASRVVLQLPASWGARTQRIELQGSTNGTSWTSVKAAADYAFTPSANNTVTISFTASTQRYFRLNITSNTGWPAGQISGFQVWNV
ncbi:choice-of-anchor D domain-containing protein [Dactylosporangium fulvum]|uniref:Choice-of-anchor D domain-containing protein n=1 Tax=Dactylosporangium fulvum TaxID=53359 RepID=A0ABY5VPP8_9ACTN|nr:choice-of-anchor D domain-containing protein [Dactylosporangium fulvum]UWP79465.1 choice-of-anchor D domain-containing protein [Dactylosporangium fulvum]